MEIKLEIARGDEPWNVSGVGMYRNLTVTFRTSKRTHDADRGTIVLVVIASGCTVGAFHVAPTLRITSLRHDSIVEHVVKSSIDAFINTY